MRKIPAAVLAILVAALAATLLLHLRLRADSARQLARESRRRQAAEAEVERLESRLGRLQRHLARLEESTLAAGRRWRRAASLLAGAGREGAGEKERPREEDPGPEPEEREEIERRREALAALNRGLVRAGHPRARFFAIGAVAADHLADVSFHLLGRDGIVSRALRLERLYLAQDLGEETLRLFAPRGRICREGRWHELGEKGWQLELKGVPPGTWGAGECPFIRRIPAPPPAPPESDEERVERRLLRGRINSLLRESRGFQGRRYRLVGLGRLVPGGFGAVELLAYSPKGLLLERYRAGDMRVEELAGGGIRLILRQGFRRFSGGRQTLPPAGLTILLPGTEGAAWRKALPGRVEGGKKN